MWADELIAELKNPERPKDSITVNELADKTGKTKSTAQQNLLKMVREGELQRVLINKEWHYYK